MSNNFAVDRLKANCQVQLPGALDGPLLLAIFNTVTTFCIQTNVWQEDQDFQTRANKRDYAISASESDCYYTRLISVVRNDLDTDQSLLTNPTPVRAHMHGEGILRLHDTPQVITRLTARFAKAPRPTDNFGSLPNFPLEFWDQYHNVLVEGVLANMQAQTAKPYSQERMSILHGRRFIAGCSTAKVEALNGGMLGGQAWRFPKFA
jgi:hypothetical protein